MVTRHRLKQARTEAGYASAAAAAKAFGWPIGTYSCHENGARGITVETAKRYAAAFHIDAGWLLCATVITPEMRSEAEAGLARIARDRAPQPIEAPASVEAGAPVTDRAVAEIVSALADEYEELNERGRQSLTIRFWSAFPDLRERAIAGEGRRLARLAGG